VTWDRIEKWDWGLWKVWPCHIELSPSPTLMSVKSDPSARPWRSSRHNERDQSQWKLASQGPAAILLPVLLTTYPSPSLKASGYLTPVCCVNTSDCHGRAGQQSAWKKMKRKPWSGNTPRFGTKYAFVTAYWWAVDGSRRARHHKARMWWCGGETEGAPLLFNQSSSDRALSLSLSLSLSLLFICISFMSLLIIIQDYKLRK